MGYGCGLCSGLPAQGRIPGSREKTGIGRELGE